jgi:hypothetical protein
MRGRTGRPATRRTIQALVLQLARENPGKARAAAIMERAGILVQRRVGGLGARQREQLLAEFSAE